MFSEGEIDLPGQYRQDQKEIKKCNSCSDYRIMSIVDRRCRPLTKTRPVEQVERLVEAVVDERKALNEIVFRSDKLRCLAFPSITCLSGTLLLT